MNNNYILFLGDSLTYGYLVSSQNSFPSLIYKKLLEDNVINSNTRIINAGNPGDTTEMALIRLKYLLKEYQNIYLCVIYLSANDYLLGENIEETYRHYIKIIDSLYNYNKEIKIVIIEFLPFYLKQQQEYKIMYKNIKEKYPDIMIVPEVLNSIIHNPNFVLEDGIHPNEKGYSYIAEKIYPYILDVLR